MKEHAKHGEVGRAARAAAMDRKTGRKYIRAGTLPSKLRGERTWLTRPDPFEADWPRIREMLKCAPEVEAKIVLDYLIAEQWGGLQVCTSRDLRDGLSRLWVGADLLQMLGFADERKT